MLYNKGNHAQLKRVQPQPSRLQGENGGKIYSTWNPGVTKSDNPVWTNPVADYEDWYIDRYYRYKDTDGRRFLSRDLSAYGLSGGGYEYSWKGVLGLWRCPQRTMEKLDKDGKIYYTEKGV